MDVSVLFQLLIPLAWPAVGATGDAATPPVAELLPRLAANLLQPYIRRFQFHFLSMPQREECFFQHGAEGMHLVVHYQVMDNGGTIRFREKFPSGEETHTELESRGHRSIKVTEEGDYQYCFINLKRALLTVHISVSVIDRDKQRKLYKEVSEVPEEFQEAWNATIELFDDIHTMQTYLFQKRRRGHFDSLLVQQNGEFVAYWSLAQCCVIVLAGALQVYALRTMFKTVSVTPTNKPRS